VGLTVSPDHLGPTEAEWARSGRNSALPPLGPVGPGRVVVVAPHPDDEVLGAGGLLQSLLASGREIEILAVTDGEASHPSLTQAQAAQLGELRAEESEEALHRLGWERPAITRLGLPDGRVTDHEPALSEIIAERMRVDDLWLAPWSQDGHPDHDACGRATTAGAVATGASALGYLVWAWHWADPAGHDIPWAHCRRLDLDRRTLARKRWSTGAFRSQVRPYGPADGPADREGPVLPTAVLRRFWRHHEVFVDETTGA
jgi:LmbE family N-acetylglucosaminyl deacetylase